MKCFWVLLMDFCFFMSASVFAGDPKSEVTITEIKPALFCVVHAYPWPSNSLVAVMENKDILIIDTPYTPEATETVLDWIDKKFGKQHITAINTHFHVDRLGGNAALVKRNIPIYGSELTLKAIQERGDSSRKWTASVVKDEAMKYYYSNFEYVSPTRIFDSKKGMELHFGNETVYIRYFGTGHSVDNLFVFLPQKKVLFGGCAILSAEAKTHGNVSDGNIDEWRKVVSEIDTTGYDCVVPGHGPVGGIELIKRTEKILGT